MIIMEDNVLSIYGIEKIEITGTVDNKLIVNDEGEIKTYRSLYEILNDYDKESNKAINESFTKKDWGFNL